MPIYCCRDSLRACPYSDIIGIVPELILAATLCRSKILNGVLMKTSDDKRPRGPRPAREIEVSESHLKLRGILAAVLVVIAIAAFGMFLGSILNTEPGWQTVEIVTDEPGVSGEFTLNYLFGSSGRDATTENRELTALYEDACVKAYKLFDADLTFEGVHNVRYINDHINEEIAVDPVLYNAFGKVEQYRSRYLYLGAVYDVYDSLFFGFDTPWYAIESDPYADAETAHELFILAEFANDPDHVRMELLGDNKVRLYVSDAYLAAAEEYGIGTYIDFYRTKNAFIIDWFADLLTENGFTHANITGCDGFTRNLDPTDEEYICNIFDLVGEDIYTVAKLVYASPRSIVFMRSYPMSDPELYRFFMSEDGRIITPHIDSADGLYKSAVNNMVSYSDELGCADIALLTMPVYIADTLDTDRLTALCENGIDTVWCRDAAIFYTDGDAVFDDICKTDEVSYTTVYAGK